MNKRLLVFLALCVLETQCALIPTEPSGAKHAGHDHGHESHDGHDHGDVAGDEDHDGHEDHEHEDEEGHEDHEGHEDDHGDHEGHEHEEGEGHEGDHEDHEGHEHEEEEGHEDDHGDHEGHEHEDEEGHEDDHEDHEGHEHEEEEGHDHEHEDHEGHEHDDHHDDHEDHSDHFHNLDPFAEILAKLNVDKMDSSSLGKLLEALSDKTDCKSGDGKECSSCTTGSAILLASGFSDDDSLDHMQFEKVAHILVYYLFQGMKKICDATGGIIKQAEAERALFSGQFICHNRTESIVDGIGEHSCSRMLKCFKPYNTAFEEKECLLKDDAAEQGVLSRLLLPLLSDCKCTLPEPEHFNINIMEAYGTSESEMPFQGFKSLLAELKIGNVGETEAEAGHEGHDHRKKRDTDEHDHEEHATKECYTGEELFEIYEVDESAGIDTTQFTIMCPALVQQVVSGACHASPTVTATKDEHYKDVHKYGYGTAAVFIISMLAFIGLLVFPSIGSSGYTLTMQFFIALGVGTMSGDALLHIIPEVVGLHVHGAGDTHDHEEDRTYLWRLLVVVAGMYAFYLFENAVRLWNTLQNGNVAIHLHQHGPGDHDHRPENFNDRAHTHHIPDAHDHDGDSAQDEKPGEKEEREADKLCGMSTVAIMVLIGDVLHNFGDGIAIGVAFSSSWVTGVGTSIAVFCHELPHEFGDFAIYMKNGMSKWKALAANFGAACAAFVGLYLGIGVATDPQVRHWIMAVIAGMFIYISLVDVLHEMLEEKTKKPVLQFVLQNLGLILGWAILLLIAIYEEDISRSIGVN